MSFEGPDRASPAYRPEVDGLRAIAVLAVMAFHARLPGFEGGYAGVDVFFVISGYLITGIILRTLEARRFSFRDFYARRALRILPALTVVLLACAAAALLLLPFQARQFGASLMASVAFAANLYFWRTAPGYFDQPSETQPLIHLWSLAVEEQFYLLYPLALVLAWRFLRGRLAWLAAAALLLSLALAVWASGAKPAAAYYLLPTRAWELLAGALLATAPVRPNFTATDGWRGDVLALLGLALIAGSIAMLDGTSGVPGLAAIPVVLGTVLFLAFAAPGQIAGGLLGSRPFVAIGLVSYSAYLWHQPLLAYARVLAVDHIGPWKAGGLLLAAFALAALTWRFVEQPFRRSPRLRSRRVLFAGAAASAMLASAGLALWALDGVPQRFSARTLELAEPPSAHFGLPCFSDGAGSPSFEQSCRIGAGGPAATAFLGDSHAMVIAAGFEARLDADGEQALLMVRSSCPPVLQGELPPGCARFNQRAIRFLVERPEIDTVILAARWTRHLEGPADNAEGGVEAGEPAALPPAARRAAAASLRDVVGRLLGAGKRVILIYPVPEAGWHVPLTMIKRGQGAPPLSVSHAWFARRNAAAYRMLDAAGDSPRLTRLYPARGLCDTVARRRCALELDGVPLYFDDDHLTEAGVNLALWGERPTAR